MEGTTRNEKRVAVIAMDGSEESELTLRWFAHNIYRKGDEVVAVHCLHHTAHYTMGSVWTPIDSQAIVKAFEEETARANQICKKIEQKLHDYEVEGRVLRVQGDPGDKILEAAKECNGSFIVVGSRGLGLIRRTVIGSVSDYILHHSDLPVLVHRK